MLKNSDSTHFIPQSWGKVGGSKAPAGNEWDGHVVALLAMTVVTGRKVPAPLFSNLKSK